MAPPPSTPTPHRFLVPKRSATQRTDTPKPLPAGPQQFHATPRFSLHSTPREPAPSLSSSTPVRPAAFVRQSRAEDIDDDAIDSSPPVPRASRGLDISESIEAEFGQGSSALVPESDQLDESDSDHEARAPSPKRRRLSLPSDLDHKSPRSSPGVEGHDIDQSFGSDDESDRMETDEDEPPAKAGVVPQPRFQAAPRFKAAEQQDAQHHEPLPEVFSPHRKGAKYVPGGLAAELRNWLIDIEASTGYKKDGGFVANVSVVEVRGNSKMQLILGQILNEDSSGPPASPQNIRVVLAGEGRLLGLARKNHVVVGSLIGIAKPVWEVDLGIEGRWLVACDWVVL
ncbi:hypothetical protein BX600DRAFT_247406 [Xylariales sp. PMI_506]|nr:hypothetical protein BX600DRAFT_247406 [Xylariales sp. PMI_506]